MAKELEKEQLDNGLPKDTPFLDLGPDYGWIHERDEMLGEEIGAKLDAGIPISEIPIREKIAQLQTLSAEQDRSQDK